MANSEVPDSFGFLHEKWLAEAPVPFAAPAVRDRMIPVLRAVAASGHPYLRVLATCKELTLSRSVAGLDDDKSLDRLQDLLLDASVRWPTARALDLSTVFMLAPEDEYLLLVAPRLFASLGLQILNKSLEGYTEHQRRNGKALEDVCATHPVAQRLRAVFGLVLEALTHVPGIEVEKRVRLARVAEGLISSATEWGFGKALFTDHFRDAVAFLRADRDRLKPLL
jgi:hypothetical protein